MSKYLLISLVLGLPLGLVVGVEGLGHFPLTISDTITLISTTDTTILKTLWMYPHHPLPLILVITPIPLFRFTIEDVLDGELLMVMKGRRVSIRGLV